MEIKEKILKTAHQLFLRYGLKGVTMDDIARELVISKKTIYQYFKDKKEMVLKVCEFELDHKYQLLLEARNCSENAVEEFYKTSVFLRKMFNEVNPVVFWDMQKYFQETFKMQQEYIDKVFLKLLIDSIRKGMDEGLFRAEIDPEILAVMRMQQIQLGFNFELFPRDRYDFTKVQMELFNHFIHGMVTPKGKELFEHYIKTQTNELKTEA